MGRPKFPDRNGRGEQMLVWDPTATISPHAIIVGSSGTGKTYRLRYIIEHLIRQRRDITIHVLDVHGDIAPAARNRIVFSEATEYGLNPLEIESDPEFGGVRKRINSFIDTINRTSHKLGSRQEAVMRALLKELYLRFHIDPKNARTWDPLTNPTIPRNSDRRRYPTVSDLVTLAEWRVQNLVTGAGDKALKALSELNKAQKKRWNERKKGESANDTDVALLKSSVKDLACAYIDSIETGMELEEILRFESLELLKVVLERIRSLDDAGIFKDRPPVFNAHDPFRVYDIKSLQQDEQKMFCEVLMERLFIEAKARGPKTEPDTFVIIDEAHLFLSQDHGHILNRMSREVRKFGLGLIICSQNFDHFPEDIIANSAMTLILGMHDMHHKKAAEKLNLERKRLAFIKPQQTALVQIRGRATENKLTNSFTDISLPGS